MRTCGILMHISSLPGEYGIGTLGREAYDFVDWLEKAGQTYWQILPLGPVGYGDSPYSSYSTFAGNPLFIDPDQVVEDGYLTYDEIDEVDWGNDPDKVDFDKVRAGWQQLYPAMLERFAMNFPEDFEAFLVENADWLWDYALFMAIRDELQEAPLSEWDKDIRTRQPEAVKEWAERCEEAVLLHEMIQYFFYRQWNRLRRYANRHGVKIFGDVPIYVPVDSADVWSNPEIFALDEDYVPIEVSGCPPDAFTEEGQLWGNPVYNFEYMKKDGYSWWVSRFRQLFKLCDVVRVDHFRAFDSYYCIPRDAKNAKVGVWREGPGYEFFKTVMEQLGDLPLVAEDLGFLTESVRELVRQTGFPGMKILQFAFDPSDENDYLPYNHERNCIVYPGTHDNNTARGWYEGDADWKTRRFFRLYTNMRDDESPAQAMIRTAYGSVADTAIIAMQDVLGLGAEARMNIPSTVGCNWAWRAREEQIDGVKGKWLHEMAAVFGRLPKEEKDETEVEAEAETEDEAEIEAEAGTDAEIEAGTEAEAEAGSDADAEARMAAETAVDEP
jgi:4-alpha-glucanotransferase